MKVAFFRGGFDSMEKVMNEFFDEVGYVEIKHVKMTPTTEKDNIGEPVVIVMLLYEELDS